MFPVKRLLSPASLKASSPSFLSSSSRLSSTLLVIEGQGATPSTANLHALTAASQLGFPVTALVAAPPAEADAIAKTVALYPGIQKVLVAKNDGFAHSLAEPHADLLSQVAKSGSFSHVVAAHSPYGKNVFPRAAALLDVSPVSDIIQIDSPDTFKRPIYAGMSCCFLWE